MNLSDFSVTWAYTRGSLYTGSFGSQGFKGAYTRVGLYAGGLIRGVLRYIRIRGQNVLFQTNAVEQQTTFLLDQFRRNLFQSTNRLPTFWREVEDQRSQVHGHDEPSI